MHPKTAQECVRLFKNGELSAQAIAEATLKRIQEKDSEIKAFLSVFKTRLLDKAAALDKKRKEGKPLGKLAGVPVAIKDNMHVKGETTTCASRFLAHYKAPFQATAVSLLEEEDALLVGKTNLDEFAMGSSTESSAYQLTKNPRNVDCTPGGSSGGSAAAVGADFCPLALGSDTGGSIRLPAAFCGVVGFKPTYGRVSRYGLVAFGSSLDQIGPFATCVSDVALSMEVIGKYCKKDATSVNVPPENYLSLLSQNISGSTIGVPWKFLEKLHPSAKENFLASIEVFKALKVRIVEVDLDILKYSIAIYYILANAEASTNLARFDGIRYGNRSSRAHTLEEVYNFSKQEGFGPEVKRRILLGTFVLSSGYKEAYYKKAQQMRTLIIQRFQEIFRTCSLVALPTAPFTAFPLGTIQDPLQMYLLDIYTIAANLAGLPAISVPSGISSQGLPYGLQLIGPQRKDSAVLAYAHAFEQAHPLKVNYAHI